MTTISEKLLDIIEAKTPHGKEQQKMKPETKPRPPDSYQRHAVVAMYKKKSKKGPITVKGAHKIARYQGVKGKGPKLPYYRKKRRSKQSIQHPMTLSGKKNIRRHSRERGRHQKDDKYYRIVGRKRGEYEGPWRIKGESIRSLINRIQALVEND